MPQVCWGPHRSRASQMVTRNASLSLESSWIQSSTCERATVITRPQLECMGGGQLRMHQGTLNAWHLCATTIGTKRREGESGHSSTCSLQLLHGL